MLNKELEMTTAVANGGSRDWFPLWRRYQAVAAGFIMNYSVHDAIEADFDF